MLATEPRLAIVWDEGYTLGREARLRDWFRALADPPGFAARGGRRPRSWSSRTRRRRPGPASSIPARSCSSIADVLAWFWPFAREEPHGHPPFYALLGLVGDVLAPSWQDLPRARLGPILLFSLTAGAIFALRRPADGAAGPAALAAGSWVLQPNLFGHGHYAAYDAVLTSLWVLAIIVFAQAVDPPGPDPHRPAATRWGWTVLFGLILGCAAATKLTGWFLPLAVPGLGGLVSRPPRPSRPCSSALAIAVVVLFALMPPWWSDPIGGVVRFLAVEPDARPRRSRSRSSSSARSTRHPTESLPWYNTLVWTVLVTPVGLPGARAAGTRRRPWPGGGASRSGC